MSALNETEKRRVADHGAARSGARRLPAADRFLIAPSLFVLPACSNTLLPPNRRDTPIACGQRALQAGSKVLGAAALVYALWSVINYIAPRGDSNTSGLPRQDNFDFDHL